MILFLCKVSHSEWFHGEPKPAIELIQNVGQEEDDDLDVDSDMEEGDRILTPTWRKVTESWRIKIRREFQTIMPHNERCLGKKQKS